VKRQAVRSALAVALTALGIAGPLPSSAQIPVFGPTQAQIAAEMQDLIARAREWQQNARQDAVAADSRIQVEEYRRDKVYVVYAAIGMSTLIQLQEGETIDPKKTEASGLGMGFGDAWTLGVRENNIFLKPAKAFPDTNMLIVTNRRTYVFDLKRVPRGITPTYVMSFTYAQDDKKAQAQRQAQAAALAAQAAAAQAETDRITAEARAQRVSINTEYYWRGDNALLAPTAAWDDGRFTRLRYAHAGEIPVFFKVLPDGTEALINANVDPQEKDVTVLQEVARVVRARLGDDVIEIVNHAYSTPSFNKSGATEHGTVRVEKAGGTVNGR
jgi:type IV secretion system protein VirB9